MLESYSYQVKNISFSYADLFLVYIMQGRMSTRWRQLLIFSISPLESVYFVLKKGLSFRTGAVLSSCCGQNCKEYLIFKKKKNHFTSACSCLFFGYCLLYVLVSFLQPKILQVPVSSSHISSDKFMSYELACRYEIKVREQQALIRNQRKSQV